MSSSISFLRLSVFFFFFYVNCNKYLTTIHCQTCFQTAISGILVLHILASLGPLYLNLGSWRASLEFCNLCWVLSSHSQTHQLLKVIKPHLCLQSAYTTCNHTDFQRMYDCTYCKPAPPIQLQEKPSH